VKHASRLLGLMSTLLLSVICALAQDIPSGKYEGTAKGADGAEVQITLELKSEGGKISGHLMRGTTNIEVSEGMFSDGKLSLKLGPVAKDGVLTAKVDGDKLIGDWMSGADKRSVELKKAGASSTPNTPSAAATPINLNGQWDAVADANGQEFPFTLVLKIEGEKVSGSSSSQLGESNVSSGTWKDGRLSLQLESQSGVVTLNAVVIDGKLSGEYDYASQLQGKWVAVKKN